MHVPEGSPSSTRIQHLQNPFYSLLPLMLIRFLVHLPVDVRVLSTLPDHNATHRERLSSADKSILP